MRSFLGEDYGKEYSVGDGYHKFIRYLVDYALRFVLSERAKNKHLEIADKTKAETYWEHLEAIEKREKAKYTIQYKEQKC